MLETMKVEMTEAEAQEFATWLREKSKEYAQRADRIAPISGASNGTFSASGSLRNTEATPQELENAVRSKSGRVNDLAERLHLTPTRVQSLLEPASKVYVGERGWLKVRD